jgi:predicted ATPase
VGSKSTSTILEEVILKEKINNLLTSIDSVIHGEFKEDETQLLFAEEGLKRPVALSSVSTGIKMFLIIKRLLELGKIHERDVLIFDEPEIHLHPAWQLRFAEILVLLQKEFDLTILLTTHSPYFLRAIEIYAEKHKETESVVNCYLAETEGGFSKITDVSDSIDVVYKQLAMPFQQLEDLHYED